MRDLHQLGYVELVSEIRDLLHLRGAAAGRIDRRIHELPYEPVVREYESGEDHFREKVERATRALLREAFAEPWPAKATNRLAALVQETGMSAVRDDLKRIFFSGVLNGGEDDRRRKIMLLATLLDLGWKPTPDLWKRQSLELQKYAPDLVFRGYWAHGIEQALEQIPNLVRDEEAAIRITNLLPSVLEQESWADIQPALSRTLEQCTPEVRGEIEDWIDNHDLPRERDRIGDVEEQVRQIKKKVRQINKRVKNELQINLDLGRPSREDRFR